MYNLLRKFVIQRLERYSVELLEKHKPKVIAITGSVGKTSTKQATAHLLEERYRVLSHSGNYNTEFGLPLSLFELEAPERTRSLSQWLRIFTQMRAMIKSPEYPYDIVVLEMGADKPGDIRNFTRYIQPDISVVTAVAKVHMEEFETIEAILEEKWLLAEAGKRVFYNHDDKRLREKAGAHDVEMYGYGLSETDYWAQLDEFDEAGVWNSSLWLEDEQLEAKLPVVAQQSVYSLVVAAGIAHYLEVPLGQIKESLATWQQPPGRMRVLRGKNDSVIIDDSYNASPYATVAALDALEQFSGRHLAILGSMNELGDYEVAGHRLVGKHCGNLEVLSTIGVAANKYLIPAAMEAGINQKKMRECMTPHEAGDYIATKLSPGDVVLVKGSQNGVYAEEAIKALLAEPEDAVQLVRQSPEWLRKKQEQFSSIKAS